MGGGDGDRDRALLGQSLASLPRSAPSALHSCAIAQMKAATIGRPIVFFKPAFRHDSDDRVSIASRPMLKVIACSDRDRRHGNVTRSRILPLTDIAANAPS